jgi:predicted nucleic acid-binding protein
MRRQTDFAESMMNSATSSAAGPVTTNTFRQPADAVTFSSTPASRWASCRSHNQKIQAARRVTNGARRDRTDESCLIDAMDAVAGHGWSFWDAMMWATARRAGCRLLLSEDGDDGRTLGGVTLVNPFASPRSPLLTQALGAVPARSRRPRGGAR